ncbi:MAG TPA: PTS sugar transporter subunit IIA [Thermoanaerobaculia bacterium]|jgi:PTS system nitrogen regulatory IIA component
MELASLTSPELIFPRLEGADRTSVLRTLAHKVAAQGHVRDAQELFDRLLEREEVASTGVGGSVAIPHCKMSGLDRVLLAIGLLEKGIDFAAVDGQPVRLFFLVVSPSNAPAAHLQCLAAISKWVRHQGHVPALLDLDDAQAIYDRLREEA